MYILLIYLLCEYRPTSYLLPLERAPEQKLACEDRISQVKCDLAHSNFPFSKKRKSNRKRSDNDMLHQGCPPSIIMILIVFVSFTTRR